MAKSLGGFRAALLLGWFALCVVAISFARVKAIPAMAALPVLAAFLIEFPFYLVAGFPKVRERLARPWLPAMLVASSVLPYFACCAGAIAFDLTSLLRLLSVALVLSLWYVILSANPFTDILFLMFCAAILLGKYFDAVYPVFYHQPLATLGRVSLFSIAILALMLIRRVPETGFGFFPTAREWRIGILHFLGFIPAGLGLAFLIDATHLVPPRPFWTVAATFFGMLWVIGLAEEFFFRGVLQQWLEDWTANRTTALLLASALFGLVHYWFRGWLWVPVAALLGLFCGHARNQAGGIRAGAVTHALVVATWRAFLW